MRGPWTCIMTTGVRCQQMGWGYHRGMRVIKTVQTPATGIRQVSGLTSVSGVGDAESTLITINDDAVLKQWENHGVAVHALKGDGRAWMAVLPSAPTSPVAGDVWLELDGVLGTVLRFYDGVVTSTLTTDPPSGTLSLTASTALLKGYAVRAAAGGAAYASTVVDGSHKYQIVGLVKEDTLIGDPVEVLTLGDVMSITDWTTLTGAATLTPGSRYWLSDTPGRYTTTPSTLVSSLVGVAVSTTELLVQPTLIVLA